MTGSLSIRAEDRQGNTARGARIVLYEVRQSWNKIGAKITNFQGRVEWNNIESGDYALELYKERDGEFWGSDLIKVESNTTNDSTIRPSTPYLTDLEISEEEIEDDDKTNISVAVKHDEGFSVETRVQFEIRDANDNVDEREYRESVNIREGQTQRFEYEFAPESGGKYSAHIAKVDANYGQGWALTDEPNQEVNFRVIEEHNLSLTTQGQGEILLSSNENIKTERTETYTDGTEVELVAQPSSDYEFEQWEGDVPVSEDDTSSISIDMNDDKTITAVFEQEESSLVKHDLSIIIQGDGKVELSDSIEITGTGTETYEDGTEVEIVAQPSSDYEFERWEGDVPVGEGESSSITITMDDDMATTAVFTESHESTTADMTLYPVDSFGNELTDTTIDISAVADGENFSRSSSASGGYVNFNQIPIGSYEITAESRNVHQKIEQQIHVNPDGTEQELVFEPVGPVSGVVMSDDEEQVVEDATITIEKVEPAPAIGPNIIDAEFNGRSVYSVAANGISAVSDETGAFEFNNQLPDGTYEFIVETESGTIRTEVEMGMARLTHFSIPFDTPTPSPSDSGKEVAETNYVVSILLRNLELSEFEHFVGVAFSTKYGLIKGSIDALLDIVDDLTDLLDMGLSDLIDFVKAVIGLIAGGPSAWLEMASMMVEGIAAKQREANPYEEGTYEHKTFQANWIGSYIVVTFVVGYAIGAGAARGAQQIISSSTRLTRAVENVKSMKQSGTNRIRESLAITGRNKRRSGSDTENMDRKIGVHASVLYNIEISDSLKMALMAMNRHYRTNPNSDIENLLKNSNWGNIRGKIGEWAAIRKLQRLENLPGPTLFAVRDSLPDLKNLVPGQTYAIKNVDYGRPDGEFDLFFVQVPKITDRRLKYRDLDTIGIWDVSTGTTAGWAKIRNYIQHIDTIQTKIKNGAYGDINTPIDSGVPPILFREQNLVGKSHSKSTVESKKDLPDVSNRVAKGIGTKDRRNTGWDETLPDSSKDFTNAESTITENRADYENLFKIDGKYQINTD